VATAATSSLALALEGAETLFSLSATLQARVGKTAAELKAQHILFGELTNDGGLDPSATLNGKRPAIILIPETHFYLQVGQGSQHTMLANTGILVVITDNPRYKENHKASLLDFVNFAGGVMDDVSELFGRDTYYPFNRPTLEQPYFRPNKLDRGSDDFWTVTYLLAKTEGG
jgi:hypothetical protein